MDKTSQTQIDITNVLGGISYSVLQQDFINLKSKVQQLIQNIQNQKPNIIGVMQSDPSGNVINVAKNLIKENIDSITNTKLELTNDLNNLQKSYEEFFNIQIIKTQKATEMNKKFNFKKISQNTQDIPQGGLGVEPSMLEQTAPQENILDNPVDMSQEMAPNESNIPFGNQEDLLAFLGNNDHLNSRNNLIDHSLDKDKFASDLEKFYEDGLPETKKMELVVTQIWPNLNNSAKKPEVDDESVIEAPYKSANINEIKKIVQASNKSIEDFCKKNIKKSNTKSFNLKTAQHKTLEQVVMYGPSEKRIDSITGQMISDWHVVERNKGWGFRVGDLWNIDFETIWRTHIMDKYSQEYRDKDGNWVGGYINKRFEVDSWIPEGSNLQLKPGELRRQKMPSEGLVEARMQQERFDADKKNEAEKPFNWKEASNKKKT